MVSTCQVNEFFWSFCCSNAHPPAFLPILLAVVSKHISWTQSVKFQSSSIWRTAAAWASPVSLNNFGHRGVLYDHHQTPALPTGQRYLFLSKMARSCHPNVLSEGAVGPLMANASFIWAAIASRCFLRACHTESLFKAICDWSCPKDLATAAKMYMAFLSLTFVRSKAATLRSYNVDMFWWFNFFSGWTLKLGVIPTFCTGFITFTVSIALYNLIIICNWSIFCFLSCCLASTCVSFMSTGPKLPFITH